MNSNVSEMTLILDMVNDTVVKAFDEYNGIFLQNVHFIKDDASITWIRPESQKIRGMADQEFVLDRKTSMLSILDIYERERVKETWHYKCSNARSIDRGKEPDASNVATPPQSPPRSWMTGGLIILAFVLGGFCAVLARGWRARRGEPSVASASHTRASEWDTSAEQSSQAVISELRSALASREETISDLREKGKRVVADRDKWEAKANQAEPEISRLKAKTKELELEISRLKRGAAAANAGNRTNKFFELKGSLARMFHPDALGAASSFERLVREALYKEINAEIDRIDRGRTKPP